MSEPALPAIPRRWRERLPPTAAPPSRRRLVRALLLVLALAAGALLVALPYLRPPVSCQIALITVGAQQAGIWPALAWREADHEALRQGNTFTSVADTPAAPLDQAALVQALSGLRHPRGDLVVYLSAPARTDARGRVHLLPADADLTDPATWLPLARVLELLRQTGARSKLLLLDLEAPTVAANQGLLLDDVAACIPADLDLVPDDRRLVLTTCGPGQVPHRSEVLGRTVFGYYVEQGLRGQGDASGDGRVTVHELADYVRAHVERWSQRVRGERQTPVLHGTGSDFVLTDLPGGEAVPPDDLPEARPYPAWLSKAWHKALPHQRAALLDAERAWRNGMDGRDSAEAALRLPAPHRPAPPPQSLARALSGATPPRELLDSLREAVFRAETTGRGLPAAKADEARSRIAASFLQGAGKTPAEVVAGVILATAAGDPRPGTLEFLASILHTLEPEPRYSETLALVQLAALVVSRDVAQQALDVVVAVEQAAAQPAAYPWLHQGMERIAQQRHEALLQLAAQGYTSRARAADLLDRCAGEVTTLLAQQQAVLAARAAVEEARRLLPVVLAQNEVTGRGDAAWLNAVQATRALASRLEELRRGDLAAGLDDLRRLTGILQSRNTELGEPFSSDGVRRHIRAARRSSATSRQGRELEGLLTSDQIASEERPALWSAAHDLERRLIEEVLRLDRHDGTHLPEVPPEPPAADAAVWMARRARQAVALLGLSGREPPSFPATPGRGDLATLEVALRRAWSRAPAGPDDGELWTWLADRYRYEAREHAILGTDTPAARFYARAASAYRPWLPQGRERYVEISEASDPPRILPDVPATYLLEVRPVGADAARLRFEVLTADEEWLAITPAQQELPAVSIRTHADGRSLIPLRIALKPGAGLGKAPPPRGVLVRVRLGTRSYHRPLTVPLSARGPEVLFSAADKLDGQAITSLAIRAVPGQQVYHLFLRNPIDRVWKKLVVRLSAGEVQRESAAFSLGPREVKKITFPLAPPPPPAPGTALGTPAGPPPLPELHGPLHLQVVDMEARPEVLTDTTVPVRLATPAEYVEITDVRFDPAGGRNRLAVRLRQRRSVPAPPVTVELVLPPPAEGGMRFRAGTLRGKLPATGAEVTLFAEGVSGEGEGRFHISVDGWARAFTFRTSLLLASPATPRQVDDPAVRLEVGPFGLAGPRFAVPLQVDQAPAGARLEVSLGRLSGGAFRAEAQVRLDSPRQGRIGCLVGPSLAFEGSWHDWTALLDTSRIRGPREVRARLLDVSGREIALAARAVTLGETAPDGVRFLTRPERVWRQVPLPLEARGGDPVVGVKAVTFFLGRPVAGKVPDGVVRIAGTPLDTERTRWGAKMPLPADRKGPTDISVEFVNAIGLSAFDTITVELTETDPAASLPGQISGTVLEGDRPQRGLKVVLSDEKGAEKGNVETREDGTFTFANLAPGKYRLSVAKPANGRRGLYPRQPTEVIDLKPGARVTAEIPLFIP